MTYFLPGLWHLAAAMAFAATFGAWQGGSPLHFLGSPAFSFALVVCSSAFFWVPDRWAKKGALKFLHYPLPDWDVLFLGPASHRNWLTHSALLPLLLLGALWKWPHLANPLFFQGALGACVGVGSHLFWDCVGSKRHAIVVVPYWWTLREAASRVYLLAGSALSLCIGGALCGGMAGHSAGVHLPIALWPLCESFARLVGKGL